MISSLKHWLHDNGANSLTASRVVLIIIIAFYAFLNWPRETIFTFAVIGGLTDLFDGPIARRTKITIFGTLADPIADKFLTLEIGLLLWWWLPSNVSLFAWWTNTICLFVLNGINIFLLIIGIYAYLHGLRPKSNLFGRLKMGLDCINLAIWWVFTQPLPFGIRLQLIPIDDLLIITNTLLFLTILWAIGSIIGHWREHYHKLNLPRQLFWLRVLVKKLTCFF